MEFEIVLFCFFSVYCTQEENYFIASDKHSKSKKAILTSYCFLANLERETER